MGKILSPSKLFQLIWDEFLTHFMRKFCLAKKMLELENQFLALTKGSMSVDEYTNSFTNKMEFSLRLIPDELTNIDWYAKGIPWEYIVLVKHAPTFEVVVRAAKSIEGMMKMRATDRTKVR